ncbi:MAG TPA: L-rhamnose/proton symporter RhaT [Bryobacteraceae bacterium]|nr:L-rhamnose/proton symporter RhaT [Bryobacteraceae bacterium]
MIPADPILGTFYHGVGALSSSACYTPQKKVRGWSWQTYWLAQASVCWFLLPILGAIATIPHLRTVLTEAPVAAMRNSFLLGMAYGVGGTAFGISIRYIGFSLTYAIAVGLSSVLGTLIPPLVAGTLAGTFDKPGGGYIFLGIAIGTLGIAVTGAAGRLKEQGLQGKKTESQPETAFEAHFSIGKGLALSLLAGVLSAVYNFSLNAGQPIADVAAQHGADVWQGNVVYIFSNTGAFLTTLIYCAYLHLKHKSLGEFVSLPSGEQTTQLPLNFVMAGLTGVLWYGQFFFYNLGHVRMGAYKFSSWALHMTMLVLFSGLIALILKEWNGCRRKTQLLFAFSMALLILGVFVLTYGNYLGGA